MPIITEPRCVRLAALLLVALWGGGAAAHGGAGGGPSCALRLGAWRMDVAMYQPAQRDGEMFCELLPGTGATVMLFDFIDDALKQMPIELRIVRAGSFTIAAWDAPDLEAITVAHLPARVYGEGSVLLRHDLRDEGTYLALLRAPAPNGGEWRAAYRFTVGSTATRLEQAGLIVGGSLLVGAVLAWARRRDAGDIQQVFDDQARTRP